MISQRPFRPDSSGFVPRPARALVALAVVCALLLSPPAGASAGTAAKASASGEGVFQTTREYVGRFYPRWFTYYQSLISPSNRLLMPREINWLCKAVVAINVDTYYASALVNVAEEPAILTIPSTEITYSLLALDGFGDVFDTGIEKQTPGIYALVSPGWTGTLPAGTTRIEVSYDYSRLIIRADKHSSSGTGIVKAQKFVRSVHLTSLAEFEKDISAGATDIVSEIFFAIPYKGLADREIEVAPLFFLKELQKAMSSATTQTLSTSDQQPVERFNAYFGEEGSNASSARRKFKLATRAAHAAIKADYLRNTIGRNWINFQNIGVWLDAEGAGLSKSPYLDRAGIAEYIQYGNNFDAAAYYHTFKDGRGKQLNGKNGRVYVLKFSREQVPEAERFWSLTAYNPGSIELVRNTQKKYAVASYTSGLKTRKNGSIAIYNVEGEARRGSDGQLAARPLRQVQRDAAGIRPGRQHREGRIRAARREAAQVAEPDRSTAISGSRRGSRLMNWPVARCLSGASWLTSRRRTGCRQPLQERETEMTRR